MSKNKKRHRNSSAAVRSRAREDALADQKDRDRKRMDPTARTLLLGDMVFLAICEMLDKKGLIPVSISNVLTALGVILLILALYFQFGKGNRSGGGPVLK